MCIMFAFLHIVLIRLEFKQKKKFTKKFILNIKGPFVIINDLCGYTLSHEQFYVFIMLAFI